MKRVLHGHTVEQFQISGSVLQTQTATMTQRAIEHTVTFRLQHAPKSPEETDFLNAAAKLAEIPGVQDYQIRRQTSPKNSHTFGISMWFSTAQEFVDYSEHPAHVEFVQNRWLKEVADFQEADFEPLS